MNAKECPICESRIESFLPFGMNPKIPPRQNAMCPHCKSLERHRLMWLYFKERTDLFTKPVKMLHVSPEPQISEKLKNISTIEYLSADLDPQLAMVKMDLTNIQFPDYTFDVVYASHVLEHIPDDQKAMREIYRILKQGGWAILQVPLWQEKTIEDPTITTPEDREKIFGQFDHVRIYGLDGIYKTRLEQAGFNVKVNTFVRTLNPDLITKYGLSMNEDIYFCIK